MWIVSHVKGISGQKKFILALFRICDHILLVTAGIEPVDSKIGN